MTWLVKTLKNQKYNEYLCELGPVVYKCLIKR